MAVREVATRRGLGTFIDVAWRINARDPAWVPPLRAAVASALDRRKHPFHDHAEVAYFLLERAGEPVGRIAAIVNERHNAFHRERTGFFGLFECEDDPAAAAALLDQAAEWLAARGMARMRGPMSFSTNEEIASPGVLVAGFERRPVIGTSHNPPYYAALLEAAGLEPCKDLLAYGFDDPNPPARLLRGAELVARRAGAASLSLRALDLRRLGRELEAVKSIYHSAWQRNWGFVPMTDAELEHAASQFRFFVDPALCLIAESGGEPIAFSLALPDLNEALQKVPSGRLWPTGLFRLLRHRRRLRGIRILTLGVKPGPGHAGLGALLYLRTWQAGVAAGYRYGEASWILEDNLDMRRPLENMGGALVKRYRVFERPL